MKSLLEFDKTLSDDTPIYRIVDFYAAADIVKNKHLRISRSDTFSDKNEGVGLLLVQIQISRMTDALGMGWTDRASAEQSHLRHKQSHYVSCWTETPESIAMWSMYSNDKCSVRLRTSVGKLKSVVENFVNKKSLLALGEKDLGKLVVTAVRGSVARVEYEPLYPLARRMLRRAKAYERIYARRMRNNVAIPTIGNLPERYFQREKQRGFSRLENEFYIKDISYEHEREVRFVIAMAEREFDDQLLREINEYKFEKKFDMSIILRLRNGDIRNNQLSNYAFAECGEDFVEEVSVDPRCAEHKRTFMVEWFNALGVRVSNSHSFGYIPEAFDVFPRW